FVELEDGAKAVAAAVLGGAVEGAVTALDQPGKRSRAIAIGAGKNVQIGVTGPVGVELEGSAEFVSRAVERAIAGLDECADGIYAVGVGGVEVEQDLVTGGIGFDFEDGSAAAAGISRAVEGTVAAFDEARMGIAKNRVAQRGVGAAVFV